MRRSDNGALMRNRFDWLGKEIGQAALGSSGRTVAQAEISPETQYADLRHDPDPAHAAERERLGLLGRFASVPCLIELYAQAPDDARFRACLAKHLAHWQRSSRERRMLTPSAAFIAPFLWIISAGTPSSLLAELELVASPAWPEGVYLFGGDALRVGIVAANQLPRDRSTLLVRLMAAGPLLTHAIAELSALPADAHERAVADQILLGFRHALGEKPNRTPEEEEFLVTMYETWDDARKQGREQGRAETGANAVLTVLRVRGVPVTDEARERILAETDPDRLERWLERACISASVAEMLDEPS